MPEPFRHRGGAPDRTPLHHRDDRGLDPSIPMSIELIKDDVLNAAIKARRPYFAPAPFVRAEVLFGHGSQGCRNPMLRTDS